MFGLSPGYSVCRVAGFPAARMASQSVGELSFSVLSCFEQQNTLKESLAGVGGGGEQEEDAAAVVCCN